jgi:hypothetical protein
MKRGFVAALAGVFRMAALTAHDLIEWLVANQFLSEARARPFRANGPVPDAKVLSKDFIRRGWLTVFQANHILQGKGERLILGPYRLLDKVGEGSMGEVFKCWSLKLQMPVAIKMIHKQHLASAKAMDRFRREMETAGKLDHPNIVLLRDADEIDDHPFMVMDFVDGTDLSRLVKKDGPLPVAQAVDYARQAALGLQHAYERDVVHRDIKPGNLLVTRDAVPVLKISDFGLARFESERGLEGRLTQHGAVLGTVDYIAPEQAENAQVADIRADIYSLGCALYYLLTAKPPFPGTDIVEKVRARLTGELGDVCGVRPEVPAGLSAVLRRMTARAPADRYQTPREVALALEPFAASSIVGVAAAVHDSNGTPAARPVAAAVGAAGNDPFAFSDTDIDSPYPPPEESAGTLAPRPAASPPNPVLAALGGGILALLLVGLLFARGCSGTAPQDAYPDASLELTLQEKSKTMALGDKKRIAVSIKRTNFTGKVDVTLENMPEGIGPNPNRVVIDAQKTDGELPIFVYQFAKRETVRLRVRAIAKNLSAEEWIQLTVVGGKVE